MVRLKKKKRKNYALEQIAYEARVFSKAYSWIAKKLLIIKGVTGLRINCDGLKSGIWKVSYLTDDGYKTIMQGSFEKCADYIFNSYTDTFRSAPNRTALKRRILKRHPQYSKL